MSLRFENFIFSLAEFIASSSISNAVTGNYIVWTTGTDQNLAPCYSAQPAKMLSNKTTM